MVSAKMVHSTLHNDLKLFRRLAIWVLNSPEEEMKEKPARMCYAVMVMITEAS
jgi:hypothetical protein